MRAKGDNGRRRSTPYDLRRGGTRPTGTPPRKGECRREDPLEGKRPGVSNSDHLYTRLQRIAKLARENPKMVIHSLSHHIDLEMLQLAFALVRKSGAPGVDAQTAEDYATNLVANLESLLHRFKSGTYRAPPVRRVHIPKGDGKTRPIGIPTFEDKVLQRAVTMVMSAVYEEDFHEFSYGFRPKRSAHGALQAVREVLESRSGGWVVEVDIKSFYDTLVPAHLRAFLDQRVTDGVIRRTIDKWLKAGVFENGATIHPDLGTPQGGVISPLLSNIYLHEVLDKWFVEVLQPQLRGSATLVRYADDFVIVTASEDDAKRAFSELPKRFSQFGLTIHPEKSQIVPFLHPARAARMPSSGEPGTFDLLGFTHHWGQVRDGKWVVMRKTATSRMTRALTRIREYCRVNRHKPVSVQHADLSAKLNGHFGYYGIPTNSRMIRLFRYQVERAWQYWLNRRSDRRSMPWERFRSMSARKPLPAARIRLPAPIRGRTFTVRSRMR